MSTFHYGLVIADERHNLPANQAYQVMNSLNARYKYSLSATPQRRDNLEFMIKAAVNARIATAEDTYELSEVELSRRPAIIHSKQTIPEANNMV